MKPQIVPESYVKLATTPSAHGPDYGFLWWLNTLQKHWVGVPATAFAAEGSGGNIIFISPENDLVVVWRWSANAGEGFKESDRLHRAVGRLAVLYSRTSEGGPS